MAKVKITYTNGDAVVSIGQESFRFYPYIDDVVLVGDLYERTLEFRQRAKRLNRYADMLEQAIKFIEAGQ